MASAEFSELYKHTGGLCQWSPDGTMLASGCGTTLAVRDSVTLNILKMFTCIDTIDRIEWSFDSKLVLAVVRRRQAVEVWSIERENWTCRITEGIAGLVHGQWAADGRHILSIADFQLHMTVWSLLDGSAATVPAPKSSSCISFSPNGQYAAVGSRVNCKDLITIYSCSKEWKSVVKFHPATRDLAEVSWSPDGQTICARDCALLYAIFLYSLDGKLISRYTAYENALGVRTMAWSSSGEFLAVGSFDNSARLLNSFTWRNVAEYPHPRTASSTNGVLVYEEITIVDNPSGRVGEAADAQVGVQGGAMSGYKLSSRPVRLPAGHPTQKSKNGAPKKGVHDISWSADNNFIATRSESSPTTVWIWETLTLRLHSVLVQQSPVRAMRWHPVQNKLALCAGTDKLYFWTQEGASWVTVPESTFEARGIRWNPTGDVLALLQKDRFCCVFFAEDGDGDGDGDGPAEDQSEVAEGGSSP